MAKIHDDLYSVSVVIDNIIENYKHDNNNTKHLLSQEGVKEYFLEKERELLYSMQNSSEKLILPTIYESLTEENLNMSEKFTITDHLLKGIFKNRFERKTFVPSLDSIKGCPICDGRMSNTIDHYLPKEIFYPFIITPINLIPLCTDCNNSKRKYFNNEKDVAPFHPYFEDYDFKNYVEVNFQINDRIEIRVIIKEGDDDLLRRYKKNYYEIYKLDHQYDILAATVFNEFLESLVDKKEDLTSEIVKESIGSKYKKISPDERTLFRETFLRYLIFKKLYENYNFTIYQSIMNEIDQKIKMKRRNRMEFILKY